MKGYRERYRPVPLYTEGYRPAQGYRPVQEEYRPVQGGVQDTSLDKGTGPRVQRVQPCTGGGGGGGGWGGGWGGCTGLHMGTGLYRGGRGGTGLYSGYRLVKG